MFEKSGRLMQMVADTRPVLRQLYWWVSGCWAGVRVCACPSYGNWHSYRYW